MSYDVLNFHPESIFEFPDKDEFEVLQRLSAYTSEFRSRIAETIESILTEEKEYAQKGEAVADRITQLNSIKEEKLARLDDIVVEKNVLEKKIAIAEEQQTKLKEEIDEAKSLRESTALEIVDLEQELLNNKKLKKNRWNAIKMACMIYKDNLNFHIHYESREDHDLVKVTFFRRQNHDRDRYYVNLLNYKNSWKVGQIEPELKESHLKDLETTIDTTKPLDVLNVIVYLCKLRNIFSKHYFNQ